MAPKGGKKSKKEIQPAVATDSIREEAEDGVKGGKSRQEEKEEKRKADLARKAENARLLAEEEAAAPPKKSTTQKKGTKNTKPAGPSAIAAGGSLSPESTNLEVKGSAVVESYAATGIDDALDLLDVVTGKMDKASVGQQAAGIERHPERRFKATYEAYEERELPNIKQEDLLYKQFQKSPENPFNQTTVAYNAKKDDKLEALKDKKEKVEERLREK